MIASPTACDNKKSDAQWQSKT
eukprot:COSAG02_NODE_44610_length_364_cov_1.509434_1_plen_21_part_01